MKLIRINSDGTMNDITIDTTLNKKTLSKSLTKNSISKGEGDINLLYKWKVHGNYDLLCYGWYDGQAGFENKHDLPPSGISDFIDDEDDSDKKLLFGDIFILLQSSDKFMDIDVTSYANYYELLFDGFDDCNTSDDDISEEENEEDKGFINDDDTDECSDSDSSYNSVEELDIDGNNYTDESDYDSECEGEEDTD
jgi:hypothetical protein